MQQPYLAYERSAARDAIIEAKRQLEYLVNDGELCRLSDIQALLDEALDNIAYVETCTALDVVDTIEEEQREALDAMNKAARQYLHIFDSIRRAYDGV